MRLRHRPEAFMWRGDEYDFHRIADGVTLPCLDRFTEQQQPWLLHSGRVITPTGAEVRDIIKQVHDIDVIVPGAEPAAQAEITESAPTTQAAPAQPPESILDAALEQAAAEDPGDLFPNAPAPAPEPAPDPMGDALERQRIANARLLHKDDDLNPQAPSDWDMDGQGVVEAMPADAPASTSAVPEAIALLMLDGESIKDAKARITDAFRDEINSLNNRRLRGERLGEFDSQRLEYLQLIYHELARVGDGG